MMIGTELDYTYVGAPTQESQSKVGFNHEIGANPVSFVTSMSIKQPIIEKYYRLNNF